jgi:hypothetical protein
MPRTAPSTRPDGPDECLTLALTIDPVEPTTSLLALIRVGTPSSKLRRASSQNAGRFIMVTVHTRRRKFRVVYEP